MTSDNPYSQGGRGEVVLYSQSYLSVHELTYNLTTERVVVPLYVALLQGKMWPELCTHQTFFHL